VIVGLLWLLACQLVGEVLVRVTGAPLPGPVVGMVLLFVVLWRRRPGEESPVMEAGEYLLAHLQLFFVPAGVGVVAYLTVLRDHALPVAVALVGSWLLGLLVVGWLVTLALRHRAAVAAPGGAEFEEDLE